MEGNSTKRGLFVKFFQVCGRKMEGKEIGFLLQSADLFDCMSS